MSVAALVVAVQPDGARAAGACEYNTAWGTPDEGLAKQVVDLVNQHRAGLGLSSVAHSATLMQAAEWKAGHMLGNGYMDHDDPAPAPRTADERLVDCGYRSPTWGENIAYGQSTAKAVMDSWLTSEGHRENIERPAFTAIGVGAVRNSGTPVYWTQVFGLGDGEVPPVSLLDLPVPAAAPASPANVAPVAKPSHARASKGKRTIKRRGRVAARRARGVGIQMRNATKLSVKVRVKGRKGTRLMLRCGGQVKARGIVRKRSLVRLNARRVVGTSCRVIIRAPKRSVSYRLIAVAS